MINLILIWLGVSVLTDYIYMIRVLNDFRKGVWKTNPPSVEFLDSVIKDKSNQKWIVTLAKYEYRFAQIREFVEKIKSKERLKK